MCVCAHTRECECAFVYIYMHIICACASVNVCMCVCVCTCRMGHNVPEDDNDYSTVDDVQRQMIAIPGNPAYKFFPEHDQQSMQEDNPAYTNMDDPVYVDMDISQQEAVVSFGKLRVGYGSTPGAAASDK